MKIKEILNFRSPLGKMPWILIDVESNQVFCFENVIELELRNILEEESFRFEGDHSLDRTIQNALLLSTDSNEIAIIRESVPELLPTYFQQIDVVEKIINDQSEKLLGYISKRMAISGNQLVKIDPAVLKSKISEMSLLEKVDDVESFTNPGLTSPFNKSFYHPKHLVKAFGCAIPFLEVNPGNQILDLGCGYAWTTEWLSKIGLEAIGIDINRAYIDVGLVRMGEINPLVVVGDVENLPFPDRYFDAIFGFDAFHHIPDRRRAAAELIRVLKPGGKIVFVEPGSDHEHDPNSKDVMKKYGIIERGFTLNDLQEYFKDYLDINQIREVTLMPFWSDDPSNCVSSNEMKNYRGFVGWGIYQITKSPKNLPSVYRRNLTHCGETHSTVDLELTLNSVLNSRSWRLTYPLRSMNSILRKFLATLRNFLRF